MVSGCVSGREEGGQDQNGRSRKNLPNQIHS